MSSTQKVAVVTGALGGIGAAMAERLGREGFAVVVNHVGNAADAGAMGVQADVSDPAAVVRMFDAAESAFGGIDVLVNNGGIMQLAKLAEAEDAMFDRQVAINLKGVFNTLREAARRIRNGGRIVNVSSSVTTLLQPTYGVYAAAKAAVEAMTGVLAKEMDIARAVAFLVGPDGGWVNGQILRVNGGIV